MTEDEAREKECRPFGARNYAVVIGNDSTAFPNAANSMKCIASDCALWVWSRVTVSDNKTGSQTTLVIGGVPANIRTVDSETDGYCGLINK